MKANHLKLNSNVNMFWNKGNHFKKSYSASCDGLIKTYLDD